MNISGLDFGTSNSTIGVVKDKSKVMVPLEQDLDNKWQTTLPSALFFSFEDDQISFGREGIRRYTAGESGRLMRSMKNIMGSAFMDDQTQVNDRDCLVVNDFGIGKLGVLNSHIPARMP